MTRKQNNYTNLKKDHKKIVNNHSYKHHQPISLILEDEINSYLESRQTF